MSKGFNKTIQALIDFVDQNKHYSGDLTTATACQLLRDIEIDIGKLYTKKGYYHASEDYHNFCHRGSDKEWRARFSIGDLYVNAVICKECGWFIRSKNRHDMVTCNCGKVSVDGGSWYQKVTGNPDNYISVIEVFNDIKDKEDD